MRLGIYFPKIDAKQKFAFIICVVVMLVTHLYMFTNKLPNHDDVNRLLAGDTDEIKIQHGRWAGVIFDHVSGNSVSIPYVTGIISILAFAGTAVILVSLFQIKHRVSVAFLCSLLCTFPVSANIFMYGYIADVYFISMFLAVWGVWLIVQDNIYANVCGAGLMTLSCGCYQAFWCFGIAFIFLYYLMYFVELKEGWKEYAVRIAKRLGWVILSLVLYLIINKAVQEVTGYGATDYQGLSTMGQFGGLWDIIRILGYAYFEFLNFFYFKGSFTGSYFIVGINVFLTVYVLFMLVHKAKKCRHFTGYWVVFLLLIGLIPMAFNVISVVSMNRTHVLMQYALLLPYILCLLILDQSSDPDNMAKKNKMRIIAYVLLLGVAYNGFLTDNEIYFREQLNYEATYSYTVRLLSRIETMEGYDPSIPVALINENPQNSDRIIIMLENYPAEMGYFTHLDAMIATEPHTFVKKMNDIADFCKYYHGYDLQLTETEKLPMLASTEEFQNMPSYPQAGSMQYIDGVLVIKLAGGE